jgi:hypothetical protein
MSVADRPQGHLWRFASKRGRPDFQPIVERISIGHISRNVSPRMVFLSLHSCSSLLVLVFKILPS